MPTGDFGPRLQATTAYLSGRLGMSQRDITETFDTLFHTEIGLGSVPALETTVCVALEQPVTEAHSYVQQQPAANLDETGWREQSKRAWLWVAAGPLVSVFFVLATRGAQGARRLLGETFHGIVGSDRWSAYNWLALRNGNCVGRISNGTFKNWSNAAGNRNASAKRSSPKSSHCFGSGTAFGTAH
jgi:Transposase IS66 family.